MYCFFVSFFVCKFFCYGYLRSGLTQRNEIWQDDRRRWVAHTSHVSWKVLDFLVKFPGPGKSWKWIWSWKVLEILVVRPGKSWNFLLGCDAGGRHNGVGVGADAEICACAHLYRITELLRYFKYSVTHSLTAHLYYIVHLPLYNLYFLHGGKVFGCVAGVWDSPGKMFLGYWKVLENPGNFFDHKSVNPGLSLEFVLNA